MSGRHVDDEAAQIEERRDELAESVADLAVYSEKDRAVAGVIVAIGEDGEFRLHEALVERSALGAENSLVTAQRAPPIV
jgi:hypothetical protein